MQNEIVSALVAGFFLLIGIVFAEATQSIRMRRGKVLDLSDLLIPRRAELYREFLDEVWNTGVLLGMKPATSEPIRELHEICNKAIYTLSPYAGLKFLSGILKLSSICAKYEKPENVDQIEFRGEFQFVFMEMLPNVRKDCFGDRLDKLISSLPQ